MSGICGVVHSDGSPAARDELAGMLAHLARRAPDKSAAWSEGTAALGHALLATTPEAELEGLPLRHAPSGCVITGHLRIDNRPELFAALGLNPNERIIGDGELVLHAYLRWGTQCPDRLLGDFAFAIWDAPRRQLLCARDQAGMRRLVYHHVPGKLFAFATEPEALLAHPSVPNRINEARIADFLANMEAIDLTSTFYRDIHLLPPAHALVIEGDALRIWRYWQLEPEPPLRLGTDEAYAEAFLEVFAESVRARMRAPPGRLGAMLSGGMDSGSVAAMAARLLQHAGAPPLPTYSGTSNAPGCVETRAIRMAQTIPHLDPRDVPSEEFPALAETLARLMQDGSEPFDGHMTMLKAIYLHAHNDGIKVMLDGAAGDTTLHSDNMVARRVRHGDIAGAWREAVGEHRFWGAEMPIIKTFVDGVRCVVVPQWLRDLRQRIEAPRRRRRLERKSLADSDFAHRVNLDQRRRDYARHIALRLDGRCDDRRPFVLHPYILRARERYDRVAAPLAIEPRDPFLDLRLIRFSLSLPADQMQKDGWPKIILRNAMAGLMPDAVRWRIGKEHIGWQMQEALEAHLARRDGNAGFAELQGYVSQNHLTVANASRSDDLAVATRMTLRYLADWMSR